MKKTDQTEKRVNDTLEFYDNLGNIEPSENFRQKLSARILKETSDKKPTVFPVLKWAMGSAALFLFATLNVMMFWSVVKTDSQVTDREVYLAAAAEEYSLDSSSVLFSLKD